MPYAQINYQQTLGTGAHAVTIARAGCFLTAFCNLAERFGEPISPPDLDSFFVQHNDFIRESDGTDDLLSWGSITAFNPNIRITASGHGAPSSNDSIVKFVYNGGTTHFCLVVDAANHLILDSWDGKTKNWSVYGGPVEFASYTNVAAPATVSAKPQPVASQGNYHLNVAVPGYMTATHAANHTDQADTVASGDYEIFNQASGMVNVTKHSGVAGSWINPADNVAPAPAAPAPAAAPEGDYELVVAVPGYQTSNDAANHINPDGSHMGPGRYFTFNTAHGMVNVTTKPGTPGEWINPSDNVVPPAPAPAPVEVVPAPAPAAAPAKPANTVYSKLDAPLMLVTNKQPTHKWHLDFVNDDVATAVADIEQGTSFVAVGKAQRTDGDKPCYFMDAEDFGSADTTGVPTNNYGINTVDLSAAPDVPHLTIVDNSGATPTVTADNSEKVEVKIGPANSSWQKVTEFKKPVDFVANTDLKIHDLAGLNPDQQLVKTQVVPVAGYFTKDNVKYWITVKSFNGGKNVKWYGIPEIALTQKAEADQDNFLDEMFAKADEVRREAGNFTRHEKNLKVVGTVDGFITKHFGHKK